MTRRGYLRDPHLAGGLLTLLSGDDVWIAEADAEADADAAGGTARRHPAGADGPVAWPRLSPDGSVLAWMSRRHGAPEILLAPVDGTTPSRLTYWGDPHARLHGWLADGTALLATSAIEQPNPRDLWAYLVPIAGGPPERLPYGPVAEIARSGTTTVLITDRAHADPAKWKRYRGGGMGRLWIADGDGPFRRLLPGHQGMIASLMTVGGRIAFISDHEGVGNVYSCRHDGSDLRRHTAHRNFYARAATSDGERVVYQHAGEIWLLDDLDGESRRLELTLPARTGRTLRQVTADDGIGQACPERGGRSSLVEVAGTVHRVEHRGGRATLLTDQGRLPRALGAGAVWVRRQDGLDVLVSENRQDGPDVLVTENPEGEPHPLCRPGELGRITEVATAPDGDALAVVSAHGTLTLVDPVTGENRTRATIRGSIGAVAFSPDSRWLTWTEVHRHRASRVKLAEPGTGQVTDVTGGDCYDLDPCFTLDGRYLAFLSFRDFHPVYDQHAFGLTFPWGCRPHLVPLAAGTPSPFPGWGRTLTTGPAVPAGRVDVDGLPARLIPVPVREAVYACLRPVPGGLAWLRLPVTGSGATLERFDLVTGETTELATGVERYATGHDGRWLLVRRAGVLRLIDLAGEFAEEELDLSGIKADVDPMTRRRLALDQLRHLVPEEFWAAGLPGVGWPDAFGRYARLAERIDGDADFIDLLWEINGELGCSHAYVRPAPRSVPARARAARLGADLARDGEGGWRIERVLPSGDCDDLARSPLAAPGLDVRPGDVITAVDGRPVDPARGPFPLLVGKAGRPVELTLGRGVRVLVHPVADEFRLRYHDWVRRRRDRVAVLSAGRVGYVHVPDTDCDGWAHLHRGLRAQLDLEALVVDLRGNSGGNASPLLLDRLRRQIIAWDVPRHDAPVSYPPESPRGPVVAVTDHRVSSDGDIVTAAIQRLGLGPVVGSRTWGGVVGNDRFHQLADGTLVSVPSRPFWFDHRGWELENRGVDPDVEVLITPDDWRRAADPPLDTAVGLCLESLRQRPAAAPLIRRFHVDYGA
ncbi:peptidase S41 [Nonomuraea sp. NN258]|uniref:S41 family peptidase n=1 Tax=Nonomuraea antri TaxID=2730852 RepID=UPI00156870A5|nr:S41 family peptidase [Nonomuraea antri]NRQ31632.1 peptidase S41 [Nonomuraea antri]